AGAEKDKVVIKAGPGPTREVISALLNGSRFNFILVGSPQDENNVQRVILTPKSAEIAQAPVSNAAVPDPVPPDEAEQGSSEPSETPTNGPGTAQNRSAQRKNQNGAATNGPVGGPPNRTADGAEAVPNEVEQ